jgi:hypothetical protein|tara:strand:- start:236 stop:463 length:228 start_codon:yes stop_codon:yes gene_type:complete
MQSKIFHNTKYLEENLIVKNTTQVTYLHPKINVDVNKLLNKVKINEQSEKKKKVLFFCLGIILLSLMGIFVTAIR